MVFKNELEIEKHLAGNLSDSPFLSYLRLLGPSFLLLPVACFQIFRYSPRSLLLFSVFLLTFFHGDFNESTIEEHWVEILPEFQFLSVYAKYLPDGPYFFIRFLILFTFTLSYNSMIHKYFLHSYFFIYFFIPYVTLMSVETIHLSFKWTGKLLICVFVLHFLGYIALESRLSLSDPHFDFCFLYFFGRTHWFVRRSGP